MRASGGFGTWSDAHRWATRLSIGRIRPEKEGKTWPSIQARRIAPCFRSRRSTARPAVPPSLTPAPGQTPKFSIAFHDVAGDFVLTGSANLLLMKHVADTLAGRAIYLDLRPFCPTEWLEHTDALMPLERLFAPDFDWREWPDEPGDWPTWLLRGGFPPALQIDSETDRGLWFAAYVQTYLERDLRQLSAVSSLPDFRRMMMLAAQRTGKLLNQADLARDAALSHPTTHRYLNLLETGCLVTRIHPFMINPSAALVKAPKLLWTDCGLAAWLAGIKSSADAIQRLDTGFWLEQTLFQTLDTWRALDSQRRKLHSWRDRAGHEVDFILEEAGKLVALQIKASSQVTTSNVMGIRAFRDTLKRKASLLRGVVLHGGKARPLDTDHFALPWGWMVPKSR